MNDQIRPLMVAAQRVYGKFERIMYGDRYMEKKFTKYYVSNWWQDAQSISGPGSSVEQTAEISKLLPAVLKRYGIRTMLDIPCGDFFWMKDVALNLERYVGADIVDNLVATDNSLYEDNTRSFMKLDAVKDPLPAVDLIFCRDCLVHFSANDVMAALRNFRRSSSSYLLTTTFTSRQQNLAIETGGWRPINLQAPPFNLPTPIEVINEGCTQYGGKYPDKSLALWSLDQIDV